jgi:hypothetical protein
LALKKKLSRERHFDQQIGLKYKEVVKCYNLSKVFYGAEKGGTSESRPQIHGEL